MNLKDKQELEYYRQLKKEKRLQIIPYSVGTEVYTIKQQKVWANSRFITGMQGNTDETIPLLQGFKIESQTISGFIPYPEYEKDDLYPYKIKLNIDDAVYDSWDGYYHEPMESRIRDESRHFWTTKLQKAEEYLKILQSNCKDFPNLTEFDKLTKRSQFDSLRGQQVQTVKGPALIGIDKDDKTILIIIDELDQLKKTSIEVALGLGEIYYVPREEYIEGAW